MECIRLQDIDYSYPSNRSPHKNYVLSGITASFSEGLVYAVTGPNGSGKTTLLKLAAGILRPNSGRVSICGEDISDWTLSRVGRYIGFVLQNPERQFFTGSVMEELEFGLRIRGIDPMLARKKASEVMERLGLKGYESRFPLRLSRGEKTRLAVASIMILEPRWILLDEPTVGLDRSNRQVLISLLKEARARGQGVVMASHDQNFVHELADCVMRLDKGVGLSVKPI